MKKRGANNHRKDNPRAVGKKFAALAKKAFKAPQPNKRKPIIVQEAETVAQKTLARFNPGAEAQRIFEALKKGDIDPLLQHALKFVTGDVIGLGYMTKEELEQEAEYDCDGNEIKKSGEQIANEKLPTYIRAQMTKEITPYYLAKKKEITENGIKEENLKVTLYIPDNGRDKK